VSEADTLARAQATLERRRAELPADRLASAGAVLGALGELEPAPALPRCTCGARLVLSHERERGTCDGCASGGLRAERARELLERIPAPFRWADLDRPLVPPAAAAPVVLEEGRLAARAWLTSGIPLLTIVAEVQEHGRWVAQTGAGKTTLAAAVARALIGTGEAVEWVACRDLDPTHPNQERARVALRKAETGRAVVLDGLGKELGGSSDAAGPGVAAQRKAWMMRLIHDIHEDTKRRIICTVELTSGPLQDAYGSDFFRRIARSPRATVIRLRRVDALDFSRF
jgi:hypothetical protein